MFSADPQSLVALRCAVAVLARQTTAIYVCSKIIIFFRDLREDVTDDLLKAYYERYCEKLACPD